MESEDPKIQTFNVKRIANVAVSRYCPELPFIQIKLPDNTKNVKRVLFTFVSHDQGFCGSNPGDPPYQQSYTWFGVQIRHAVRRYNEPLQQLPVQNNVRASTDFRTHHVCWTDDDERDVVAEWVRSLGSKDIIELLIRAEYAAWVNVVKEAEMSIDVELATSQTDTQTKSSGNRIGFPYQPLDEEKKEIRLLLVHPGASGESLVSTIVHETLAPGFEAISYCWGEATGSASMVLEEGGVPYDTVISSSVYQVLRHFRPLSGTARKIWIDAVCIDQENVRERAQQVNMMSEIYKTADRVNVWLGEGNVDARLGFRIVRDIYNFQNRICPGGAQCCCQMTPHSTDTQQHQELLSQPNARNVQARLMAVAATHRRNPQESARDLLIIALTASEIISNPWFRRVWVLQEVLNSRTAVLHCGSESMPWHELEDVDSNIELRRMQIVPHKEPFNRLPTIWTSLKDSLDRRHAAESSTTMDELSDQDEELDILDIFLQALDLDATDRRDKLFALLAFGRETKAVAELHDLIRPDYTSPAEVVFANFTRWWILEYRSLSILSSIHANTGRTWQNLQTQGTDFRVPRPTWALGTEGRHKWGKATLDFQFGFRAAGRTKPIPSLLRKITDPLVLRLAGYRVAEIGDICYPPVGRSETGTTAGILEVYDRIFDPALRYGWWLATRARTLEDADPRHRTVGILHANRRQRTVEEMRGYRMWRNDHVRAHRTCGTRQELTTVNMSLNWDQDGRHRIAESGFPCHQPCFFIASDSYLGLCPANAKVGDLIVILLGGNVPFILRRVEGTSISIANGAKENEQFEFVGECYVEGQMSGSFIETEQLNGANPEIFDVV